MKLGSTRFVRGLIEADERLGVNSLPSRGRPQPGMVGNGNHRTLRQDWLGTNHATTTSSAPRPGEGGYRTHRTLC